MEKRPPLIVCLLLDLFGYFSYSIPVLGEWTDIIWAPVAAAIYLHLFGSRRGWIGAILTFTEEALPGTDFIPSFTLSWILQSVTSRQTVRA